MTGVNALELGTNVIEEASHGLPCEAYFCTAVATSNGCTGKRLPFREMSSDTAHETVRGKADAYARQDSFAKIEPL
jgi:hypothetical protein